MSWFWIIVIVVVVLYILHEVVGYIVGYSLFKSYMNKEIDKVKNLDKTIIGRWVPYSMEIRNYDEVRILKEFPNDYIVSFDKDNNAKGFMGNGEYKVLFTTLIIGEKEFDIKDNEEDRMTIKYDNIDEVTNKKIGYIFLKLRKLSSDV